MARTHKFVYILSLGVPLCLIYAVPSRNCNSESDLGINLLEGTLFCIDGCVYRYNVRGVLY